VSSPPQVHPIAPAIRETGPMVRVFLRGISSEFPRCETISKTPLPSTASLSRSSAPTTATGPNRCGADHAMKADEIEAMLAAHMAVTNIVLLELVARTRGSIAGHRYEGNGIKRLDVLGNLTTKFMRTYTMQVEALARKRRKGQQNIRVKHVHVYAGGQAVVGNLSHREGRGYRKK
jgi:hypothetical protein